MSPLFSVITPTYNSGPKLDTTYASLLAQDFGDFEYLVIDGGSSDGTRERLAAGLGDPRVRSVSEPDRGIYDAMNRGIAMARGRYLLFLGAGDILLPGVLGRVAGVLPEDDSSLVYGDVLWEGRVYDGEFDKIRLCDRNICHQAIFYGRDIFEIVGRYDLRYPLLADWALNIRCFGSPRVACRYVPVTVAVYEAGGASDTRDIAFEADWKSILLSGLGRRAYLEQAVRKRARRIFGRGGSSAGSPAQSDRRPG